MEVILLERVAKLGHMGDEVRVKDGFARNFLLPRGKALRATTANKKKFEGQRAELEARNAQQKGDAATKSTKVDGKTYVIIRQAAVGFTVHRNHVSLLHPIKTLGLHKTPVHLHPEIEANVTINVARSLEQAERQEKGEDLTVREETSMDDLGLEVGKALAEAGPGESLGRD